MQTSLGEGSWEEKVLAALGLAVHQDVNTSTCSLTRAPRLGKQRTGCPKGRIEATKS